MNAPWPADAAMDTALRAPVWAMVGDFADRAIGGARKALANNPRFAVAAGTIAGGAVLALAAVKAVDAIAPHLENAYWHTRDLVASKLRGAPSGATLAERLAPAAPVAAASEDPPFD